MAFARVMKGADAQPWSVPLRLEGLGSGVERRLVADEATRTRIAKTLGLEGVKSLEATVRVKPSFEGGAVSGNIEAEVVYLCGVTLEPFESRVELEFEDPFTTRPPEPQPPGEELGLAALDEPDYIADGVLDLGDYVVEHLSLELDPFPRKPGAVFEAPEAEEAPSPFAELARMKPKPGKG